MWKCVQQANQHLNGLLNVSLNGVGVFLPAKFYYVRCCDCSPDCPLVNRFERFIQRYWRQLGREHFHIHFFHSVITIFNTRHRAHTYCKWYSLYSCTQFIAINRSSITLLNERKNLFIGRSIYVLHLHSNFLQINFSQLYTPRPVPVRLMDIRLLYLRRMSLYIFSCLKISVSSTVHLSAGTPVSLHQPAHLTLSAKIHSNEAHAVFIKSRVRCVGVGRMDVVRQSLFGTIFMEC